MTTVVRATLVSMLVLATTGTAFAQSKLGGGVKAGVNFSTVTGDIGTGVNKSVRTAGAFGAFVSIPLGGTVSFEPEVLYSMEGVKAKFTSGSTTAESTAKVDVVEIPFLFRIATGSGSAGYLIVGPAVGIVARAKETDPSGGPDMDFKDQLKSTTVSIVVGGGFTVSHVLVEGRYSAGLTDVNKSGTSNTTNRLQVFSILFGLRF
jgi:Outer membrane protein beta-barrel domain